MLAVRPRARAWLVALFAALVLFSATVQLAHSHADDLVHSDCALCQTAHGAVHHTLPACAPRVSALTVHVSVPYSQPLLERLFSFPHCNRPPPRPRVVL